MQYPVETQLVDERWSSGPSPECAAPFPAGMTVTAAPLTTRSERPGVPDPRPPRLFMAMVPGHVLVK